MQKIVYNYIILTLLIANTLFSQQLDWQQLHAPVASSITGITQLSNGELYLATKTKGIYKSTNKGNSWTESFTSYSNIYLNDIYSTDDNKLYACGGSGIFQFNSQTQDWINLNAPQADYLSIVVNSLGHIIAGSNFGIFRSEDNGNTWLAASTITGYSLVCTTNDILFAGGDYGIYESTDNGAIWTKVGLDGFTITDIDIDNADNIYANVFYRGQGIFRSQDLGASWEQLNDGIVNELTTTVAVDLQGNIYAGTAEGGIFKKRSDQLSFNQINLHQPVSNVLRIYITQDNSLYICSEFGGLFKRDGFSLEWEQLNSGLPLEHAFPLGFDSEDNFYLGNLNSGFYRSTDSGSSWFPVAPYLGGSHLYTFLAADGQLYLGTTIEIVFVGVLFKSSDQGESWDIFQEGIPLIDPNWPYIQVVFDMDANSNGDLFAALNTKGVYRRLVSDTSWHNINSELPDTNIFSICVNSNNIVFAGYRNGYIYKSDDNGDNWVESLSGVPNYTVELLKSEGEYVFTILHDYNYPHQDSSLGLYSFDNGNTWLDLNVSGLGSRVNSIGFYNDVIVAGTDTTGVFLSSDFGANWIGVNDGLSDKVIKDIVVLPDGFLLCGTEKEGIYLADLNPVSVDEISEIPMGFSLSQNYPNPFNPTTKIKYSIPHSELVQIRIYDILGRELQTLVNEFKQAGTYELEFEAKGFSSGVYFYRIQAGDYVDTKKMVLLR